MAFQKLIVVLSGGGSTGLVKLAGSFDGLNKVKCECRCDVAGADARLFIIADEVTEMPIDGAKTSFEVPIAAKSDVYCLLSAGSKTLVGSSGGRADRRQLENRIDLYRRERARALKEKRESEERLREAARRETALCDQDGHRTETDTSNDFEPHSDNAFTFRKESDTCESSCVKQSKDGMRREAERTSSFSVGAETLRRPSEAPHMPKSETRDAYAQSVLREGVTYDGTNFYHAVKPQIDEMFVRYPAEERLNRIVPNSKWVRVETDSDDYYVLGVLFDLSLPIFICYGIPGVRSVPPPKDIADVSVWLPLDSRRPDGEGFWVIYQSATDGKCIK